MKTKSTWYRVSVDAAGTPGSCNKSSRAFDRPMIVVVISSSGVTIASRSKQWTAWPSFVSVFLKELFRPYRRQKDSLLSTFLNYVPKKNSKTTSRSPWIPRRSVIVPYHTAPSCCCGKKKIIWSLFCAAAFASKLGTIVDVSGKTQLVALWRPTSSPSRLNNSIFTIRVAKFLRKRFIFSQRRLFQLLYLNLFYNLWYSNLFPHKQHQHHKFCGFFFQ